MDNLKSLTKLVKSILEKEPDTRSSDNRLYYAVCAKIGAENGVDINKMSMPHFLLHLKDYGMPAFESVRRTRQKIQADNRELAADRDVEAQRELNEEKYRDYAKGL